MNNCSHGEHLYGAHDNCIFCNAPKPEIDFSKETIQDFIKQKRDNATGDEKRYYAAVYFVLRNRTVENWGPETPSFAEAMSKIWDAP